MQTGMPLCVVSSTSYDVDARLRLWTRDGNTSACLGHVIGMPGRIADETLEQVLGSFCAVGPVDRAIRTSFRRGVGCITE